MLYSTYVFIITNICLIKVGIENRMCYYFDDVIRIEDFDSDNNLLDEKHENILIYNILFKTFIGVKPLRIIYNKVDGFIRECGGSKYLVLFGSEKYDAV